MTELWRQTVWLAYDQPSMRESLLPLLRVGAWEDDDRAGRFHAIEALKALKPLLKNLKDQGRRLRKALPGEENKRILRREMMKKIRGYRPLQALLAKYLGKPEMDPQIEKGLKKAHKLILGMSLGDVPLGDGLRIMGPLFEAGFQVITLAKQQKALRKNIPTGIRQFLPKNLIVEVDPQGRIQEVTDRFANQVETLKVKRERQMDLIKRYNAIVSSVKADLRSSDPVIRISALVTSLLMETGIRPGQARNKAQVVVEGEKVEVATFGATTLKAEHVKFISSNFAQIEFVGKKGTINMAEVTDATVIKILKGFAKAALKDIKKGGESKSNYLFVTPGNQVFDYRHLTQYFQRKAELQGLKPYDFRRLRATKTVLSTLYDAQKDLYAKIRGFVASAEGNLRERVVDAVVKVVESAYSDAQRALSHQDVATTVEAYVNPEVVLAFLSRGGAKASLQQAVLNKKDRLVLNVDQFIQNAMKSKLAAVAKYGSSSSGSLGELLEDLEEGIEENADSLGSIQE